MAGLAVVGGPWKLKREQRTLLRQAYLPWAIRAANNADRLICLHYEQHWDKPLEARVAAFLFIYPCLRAPRAACEPTPGLSRIILRCAVTGGAGNVEDRSCAHARGGAARRAREEGRGHASVMRGHPPCHFLYHSNEE